MIRILHVVFSLEPGGMENGLVNVAGRLPADQFHVDVCCLERSGDFADRLPADSSVYVLHKKRGKSLATVWSLFCLIRRIRPHIIHTHDLGPLIYGALATLGGRSRPIVHGEHCQFSQGELLPTRLRQRRRYYRSCACIHTVSQDLQAQITELGLTDKRIKCVINGVNTERFTPGDQAAAKRQLGIDSDSLVVGQVGRFVSHKRQQAMLHAFRCIAADNADCSLLLVGDGPSKPAIDDALISHPFKNRIFMPGYLPKPENAYNAMDLLVVPSLLEGLSNAVLEAMACGVPVLSHSTCGSGEAIISGKTGFVADLSDDDKLTNAIAAVVGTPDRLRSIGKAARQNVEQSFSMNSMVEGYADMYRTVLKERS